MFACIILWKVVFCNNKLRFVFPQMQLTSFDSPEEEKKRRRLYETVCAFNSVSRWVYFKITYHDWKTWIRAFCGHVTPSCVSSFALTLCWPCQSVSFVTVVGNRQTRFSTAVTRLSLIWAPLNSVCTLDKRKKEMKRKARYWDAFHWCHCVDCSWKHGVNMSASQRHL